MSEAIDRLARNVAEIADSLAEIKAGDIRCLCCGHTAPEAEFRPGKGREFGQHPDHIYCQKCGRSITWSGYVYRDAAGVLRRAA